MSNLRKKIFYTIFLIMLAFILLFGLIFNIQAYQREYTGITTSLTRMRKFVDDDKKPLDRKPDLPDGNLHNRMVVEYDLYTFVLDSENNIIDKISHSDKTIDNTILTKASSILKNNKENKISLPNLYIGSYAYNFNSNNFLMIVDIKKAKERLLLNLLLTIILTGIFTILIYIISKKITTWITKPVMESFNKQKEFIANASHELKTPLAIMIASIDCLEETKKNKKWINNLKNESSRMNKLITRLLDLSKSESSIIQENFKVNDLSLIVQKNVLTLESLAFENKVTLETNIEEKINFLCNKESMDEVVTILIDNAIKHSFKNEKVYVNLSKIKNDIKLEIINKGEEIPKEEKEKIFERFYRSDKSRNRADNRYGLGLAIALNIVKNHNGKIEVNSKDGYTTFTIILKTLKK